MREQQEDIEAKRFLSEEDLNDNSLAPRTHRRNDARNKDKRHARKHKKREIQDALERLCENTFKFKDRQSIMTY